MRDRNVKMWMNFSFLDKNVSDNEMDKKNEEYSNFRNTII